MGSAGKDFDELRTAIAMTIDLMHRLPPEAFDGAEERDCTIDPPNTSFVISLDGLQFLRAWALPHFYFHAVTAYDILRHHGVAIGKQDYASWVGAFIRPRSAAGLTSPCA